MGGQITELQMGHNKSDIMQFALASMNMRNKPNKDRKKKIGKERGSDFKQRCTHHNVSQHSSKKTCRSAKTRLRYFS